MGPNWPVFEAQRLATPDLIRGSGQRGNFYSGRAHSASKT
jgi:hypothetical protein